MIRTNEKGGMTDTKKSQREEARREEAGIPAPAPWTGNRRS